MKLRQKIASQDFTPDMMPKTRKAVFADVLKMHWFDFMKLGLLLLVAYLPVLSSMFIQDVYEIRAIEELSASTSAEAMRKLLIETVSLRCANAIFNVVFLCLFGLVLSGVLRVIRQFAWEEVVFLWRDFWIGIKQNKGQITAILAIVGIQNVVRIYLTGTGQVTGNQVISLVGMIFTGTSILIFAPVWAFMCVQVSVYGNSFWQNVKLGFAVYAKTCLQSLLSLAMLALPWIISLLPNIWCHLIGQGVGVFLLPLTLLIWFLYVFHFMDQYINPGHFPELVGKGLFKEKYTLGEEFSDVEIQKYKKEDLCD